MFLAKKCLTQLIRYFVLFATAFCFFSASLLALAADPDLEPGFPVQTLRTGGTYKSGPGIHTLVGNIDQDPELEIITTSLGSGPLYAFNSDGSAVLGWPVVDAYGVGYPALGQLVPGGELEVFSGYWNGTLGAYNTAGNQLPGWPRMADNYITSPPTLVDLDNDGVDEILIGEEDSRLHVYRADGSSFPGWDNYPFLGGQSRFTPAVADLDHDGSPEVISVSGYSSGGVALFANHADGSLVTGFPVLMDNGYPTSYASVGDVDGDGNNEIVVIGKQDAYPWNPLLHIYSHDGTLKQTLNPSGTLSYGGAPALADLDGDLIPEIIMQTNTGLNVWKGDGSSMLGWPVGTGGGASNSAPVVGDVDGDQQPDIVVVSNDVTSNVDGKVWVFDRAGNVHPNFPKTLPIGEGAVPAIVDIDLDGRNEIIVTGTGWTGFVDLYDSVWVYDLGGSAHGAVHWGQFGGGPQHHHYYVSPQTELAPSSNLNLTVQVDADPVLVGHELTYTLAVTNTGPDSASSVQLTHSLTNGEALTGTSVPCNQSGQKLLCSLGNIAVGDMRTVTVSVTVTLERTLNDVSRVFSNSFDPDLSDNEVITPVEAIAANSDLYVTLIDSADPAKAGKQMRYDITAGNQGPDNASVATITHTLPASFTFVSASNGCLHSSGVVTCDAGNLNPGAQRQFSVFVIPTTGGITASSTVSIEGAVNDPNPGDNVSTETTKIVGGGGKRQ